MVTITSVQGNYNPGIGQLPSSSQQLTQQQQQPRPFVTRESEAKNLIIRAWRERWTDVQWGIHVRKLMGNGVASVDLSFVADCILQQALNGPGPNNLVLSYLKHSLFSKIISTSAVLKSISQYQNYYKPFCVTSLLDLLDQLKDRAVTYDYDGDEDTCMDLALALQGIVHWLLSCMYSSLENLSDMPDELPAEVEDSKIVTKCRLLLEFFLADNFVNALLHLASLEDIKVHENILKMCRENLKFTDGHQGGDISIIINKLLEKLSSYREPAMLVSSSHKMSKRELCKALDDGLQFQVVNGSIQTTVMIAALLRTHAQIPLVANDLLIIKQLKTIPNPNLYCDIIHSAMIGLADSVGQESELKFIGFTFLQLPVILHVLKTRINDSGEDFQKGLELFLINEAALDVVDAKLHCGTWELFLTSLKNNLMLSDSQMNYFLTKRNESNFTQKQNSSNAVLILKAEATLISVLKLLDGDYTKNQDAIQNVLSDMIGKSFELILTSASATGRFQKLTSKLVKLNQCSRQVNGEGTKASTTRSMIFDISFLMLCTIVQNYGSQALQSEEKDSFFEEWYRDCMVVDNVAKNPDSILARCDQNKVDLLLNQYLSGGDTDLKISLVFWHELCTNSVGVVRELLLAWENNALNFVEVKKILDVFRSRVCALPICISAWLCSYIQLMPEENCGKARFILEHFKTPFTSASSEEAQDNFKDRHAIMVRVITKMTNCVQPSSTECISDTKGTHDLFSKCWNSISTRGIVDVSTVIQLKNILDINGSSHFVYVCIQEIAELQHLVELTQWRDLVYGIFHINLTKCAESLISVVIPSLLHFQNKNLRIVEPQASALVSLAVDIVLSFYYHSKLSMSAIVKEEDTGEVHEPQTKRRKLNKPIVPKVQETDISLLLQDLYDDFSRLLTGNKCETSPATRFIYHFLEELSMKLPNLSSLQPLPQQIIQHLMSTMEGRMSTGLLLALHPIHEITGRRQCAQDICNLKSIQSERAEVLVKEEVTDEIKILNLL